MTQTIIADRPHGYLKDSDGKIVDRIINHETGEQEVSDVVDPSMTDYVDDPSELTEPIHPDYVPSD